MSTHKHFDKICCVVIGFMLILTVFFMNVEAFGVSEEATVMGYEDKLFDTSTVHTLNIVIDDWDEFTDNCQSEEYYDCTVVIDGETYKNVAIRGKGNTSLSQVSSYENDRYSFKIEFDHYDNANTYYGLDKLCLNNIIQDNTYMKDYLTYQMMAEMGVASPLCSYVYITVNGEDWGLYLAVEAVEDSFLKRNFGSDYGELYKPDSMKMGGGRGNGKQFDMEEFMDDFNDMDIPKFDSQMQKSDGQVSNMMQGGRSPEMPKGTEATNGQMPFEGKLTAQARDKYGASYWGYQNDVLDEMKDRLTFWGGIKGGFKDFFSSPQGAMTTLAIGGGILGKLFGNLGNCFSGNNQNNNCC